MHRYTPRRPTLFHVPGAASSPKTVKPFKREGKLASLCIAMSSIATQCWEYCTWKFYSERGRIWKVVLLECYFYFLYSTFIFYTRWGRIWKVEYEIRKAGGDLVKKELLWEGIAVDVIGKEDLAGDIGWCRYSIGWLLRQANGRVEKVVALFVFCCWQMPKCDFAQMWLLQNQQWWLGCRQ